MSELTHDRYGDYNETPHTDIDLNTEQWTEVVHHVLEYQIGPPVAWDYDGGMLFMWGDNLDESLIQEIGAACEDLEQRYADDRAYSAAEAARTAAHRVHRAEVSPPGERVIT